MGGTTQREELSVATARPPFRWDRPQGGDVREHRGVVLLVEDDPDIRTTLAESLDGSGYVVVEAVDGQEAIETLRRGLEPDVIVLDLMMPRMDGRRFLQQLRADPERSEIPVLVTSASADSHPAHASAWLAKPFHIDEFDRAVARLCGH